MNTTSLSLLERLRQPTAQDAWARFVRLYTPLLYHWARGVELSAQEAGDLVQDVLTILVQKLPDFVYDPTRSFRGWLRTLTLNKWRENHRRRTVPAQPVDPGALANLPAPENSGLFEEAEYRQYLVHRALELMKAEFQPQTWKACWEWVVAGRPAEDVARELGITLNAVYLAKSRVLRRLHQELQGLLD
jgi:RNA polymerase sigma-70 factor (ECF subfamily)